MPDVHLLCFEHQTFDCFCGSIHLSNRLIAFEAGLSRVHKCVCCKMNRVATDEILPVGTGNCLFGLAAAVHVLKIAGAGNKQYW
jgi:hypothetical protein